MGLFDFLKRKPKDRSPLTQQIGAMTKPQAKRIVNEFGKFLEERQPIIKDASLLLQPKARIMAAFDMEIQHVCDIANSYVRSGEERAPSEIEKYLNALQTCRMGLYYYSDIDAEDRKTVTYFNSFPSLNDVPQERKHECIGLLAKYMSAASGKKQ